MTSSLLLECLGFGIGIDNKLTVPEMAARKMVSSFGFQGIDPCEVADEIQQSIRIGSNIRSQNHEGNSTFWMVMARLEDEFRSILVAHTSSNFIETDLLSDSSFSSSPYKFKIIISKTCKSFPTNESKDSYRRSEEKRHQERDKNRSRLIYSRVSSTSELAQLPIQTVYYLRSIAERMISCGCARECLQAYSGVRKPAVNARFRMLGIEKLSSRDIQMLEWDDLQKKIRRWIPAATVCIWELFASERKLFEQIFEGLPLNLTVGYACFLETVKEPAMQLLTFAEAVSCSRRSPERLFCMLELHDVLSDLLPDIEVTFQPGCLNSVRVQAAETLSKLAEAVRAILLEFENAVLREISTVPVPGGAIHPLGRYVMNYMRVMLGYEQTLSELIVSKPPCLESSVLSHFSIESIDFVAGKPSLAAHLNWITAILQLKLEEKSKRYKDASLAHLFMMNNLYYMVQKIQRTPKLQEMITCDYLRELRGKVMAAAMDYQRSTWARVLHCLRFEGLHASGCCSSVIFKSTLRERLKTFNALFEDVCKTQATWLVPDAQLRTELQASISQKLIPAYLWFLARLGYYFGNVRKQDNYIKYSAEELENIILDFFE